MKDTLRPSARGADAYDVDLEDFNGRYCVADACAVKRESSRLDYPARLSSSRKTRRSVLSSGSRLRLTKSLSARLTNV